VSEVELSRNPGCRFDRRAELALVYVLTALYEKTNVPIVVMYNLLFNQFSHSQSFSCLHLHRVNPSLKTVDI